MRLPWKQKGTAGDLVLDGKDGKSSNASSEHSLVDKSSNQNHGLKAMLNAVGNHSTGSGIDTHLHPTSKESSAVLLDSSNTISSHTSDKSSNEQVDSKKKFNNKIKKSKSKSDTPDDLPDHLKRRVSLSMVDQIVLPDGSITTRQLNTHEPGADEIPYHKRGKEEYKQKRRALKEQRKMEQNLMSALDASDGLDHSSDDDDDSDDDSSFHIKIDMNALSDHSVYHKIRFHGPFPQTKSSSEFSITLQNVAIGKVVPDIKGLIFIKNQEQRDMKDLKLKLRYLFDDYDPGVTITAHEMKSTVLDAYLKQTPSASPHASNAQLKSSEQLANDSLHAYSFTISVDNIFMPSLYKMLQAMGMDTSEKFFQVDGVLVFKLQIYMKQKERDSVMDPDDSMQEETLVMSDKFDVSFESFLLSTCTTFMSHNTTKQEQQSSPCHSQTCLLENNFLEKNRQSITSPSKQGIDPTDVAAMASFSTSHPTTHSRYFSVDDKVVKIDASPPKEPVKMKPPPLDATNFLKQPQQLLGTHHLVASPLPSDTKKSCIDYELWVKAMQEGFTLHRSVDLITSKFSFYSEPTGLLTAFKFELLDFTKYSMPLVDLFRNCTFWLDVANPSNADMTLLGRIFGIHPLTLEDIQTSDTREKCEVFPNYYFICITTFDESQLGLSYMQPINFYLIVFKDCFHLTFVEHPSNVLRRIEQLRKYGLEMTPDWINYALIDDITDAFIPILKGIDVEVESIDDLVLILKENEQSDMLRRIGYARKKVMQMMKLLNTKSDVLKIVINRCIERMEFDSDTRFYLSDIQDHVIAMVQNLAHYEKTLARAHSNYLAQISIEITQASNRTSDVVMKMTAVASILVPLNVVTGLWGMNVKVPGQEDDGLFWFFGIATGMLIFASSIFYMVKKAKLV